MKLRENFAYTVLCYLGAFTFCTCCILSCLVCIVASFKLSCVSLLLVGRVYFCWLAVCYCFYLAVCIVIGWLSVNGIGCLVCIVIILCLFAALCVLPSLL